MFGKRVFGLGFKEFEAEFLVTKVAEILGLALHQTLYRNEEQSSEINLNFLEFNFLV